LSAVFIWVFTKASYIFGKLSILRFPKEYGAKKAKKRKVLAKERKRKGENYFENFYHPKKSWTQ